MFFSDLTNCTSDQHSNNHESINSSLKDLGHEFFKGHIQIIHKNIKHQSKGTPDTSFLDKPYSVRTLSKVLITQLDYLYLDILDEQGTNEIQIEKRFDTPIGFSNSSEPIPNGSILNLKFGPS